MTAPPCTSLFANYGHSAARSWEQKMLALRLIHIQQRRDGLFQDQRQRKSIILFKGNKQLLIDPVAPLDDLFILLLQLHTHQLLQTVVR